MAFEIDIFGPDPPKPDPAMMKLKIESRSHSKNDPGTFFEWHQVAREVYVIRGTGALRYATKIGDRINTSMDAKVCVAAYCQGFAHAKGLDGANEDVPA